MKEVTSLHDSDQSSLSSKDHNTFKMLREVLQRLERIEEGQTALRDKQDEFDHLLRLFLSPSSSPLHTFRNSVKLNSITDQSLDINESDVWGSEKGVPTNNRQNKDMIQDPVLLSTINSLWNTPDNIKPVTPQQQTHSHPIKSTQSTSHTLSSYKPSTSPPPPLFSSTTTVSPPHSSTPSHHHATSSAQHQYTLSASDGRLSRQNTWDPASAPIRSVSSPSFSPAHLPPYSSSSSANSNTTNLSGKSGLSNTNNSNIGNNTATPPSSSYRGSGSSGNSTSSPSPVNGSAPHIRQRHTVCECGKIILDQNSKLQHEAGWFHRSFMYKKYGSAIPTSSSAPSVASSPSSLSSSPVADGRSTYPPSSDYPHLPSSSSAPASSTSSPASDTPTPQFVRSFKQVAASEFGPNFNTPSTNAFPPQTSTFSATSAAFVPSSSSKIHDQAKEHKRRTSEGGPIPSVVDISRSRSSSPQSEQVSNESEFKFIHQELVLFKEIVVSTAKQLRIPPYTVEKDYWMSHLFWQLQRLGFKICLRGSVALSKGYRLIQRMSENVDITLRTTEEAEPITRKLMESIVDVSSKNDPRGMSVLWEQLYYLIEQKVGYGLKVEKTAVLDPSFAPEMQCLSLTIFYSSLYEKEMRVYNDVLVNNYIRVDICVPEPPAYETVMPFQMLPMKAFLHTSEQHQKVLAAYTLNAPSDIATSHPMVTLLQKISDGIIGRYSRIVKSADFVPYRTDIQGRKNLAFDPRIVRHYEDAYNIINNSTWDPSFRIRDLFLRMLSAGMILQSFNTNKEEILSQEGALLLDDPQKKALLEKCLEMRSPLKYNAYDRVSVSECALRIRQWLSGVGL